jgi:Tol biopolymer transport system component
VNDHTLLVFVAEANGSGERQVTQPNQNAPFTSDEGAVWSPDGRWLAFQRIHPVCPIPPAPCDAFSTLVWDIYVVRPDGSGLRGLTNGEGDSVRPSW